MMSKTPVALKLSLTAIVLVISSFSSQLNAADFAGIGFLARDDNSSSADKLSRDGSAFAGLSSRTFTFDFGAGPEFHRTYQRAFIQTPTGKRSLEMPPYESYFGGDSFYDVAAGGTAVLTEKMQKIEYFNGQGFGQYSQSGRLLWTPQAIMPIEEGLYPSVFGGSKDIYAGTTRQFFYFDFQPSHAYRHTPQGGDEDLGWIAPSHAPTSFNSSTGTATGISVDGGVVVGTNTASRASFGGVYPIYPIDGFNLPPNESSSEAFRWTPEEGMKNLGTLPGTDSSDAAGVSGDGKVVFGQSGKLNELGNKLAFRWTEAAGMTPIDALRDGPNLYIKAANFDGSILVGASVNQIIIFGQDGTLQVPPDDAVIWDAVHGTRALRAVLESDYGLNLAGWQLLSATDISDDGRTIIGNGINPEGNQEGWIVHLDPVAVPEPAAWTLFAIGSCAAAMVFRRRRA